MNVFLVLIACLAIAGVVHQLYLSFNNPSRW